MTDAERCPNPAGVIETLPENSAVIFRDYRMPHREALAGRLARLCRTRGVMFLVGGDARLAGRVGADGLHLPEWSLGSAPFSIQTPQKGLVTASAHNIRALARAALLGVDAVLLAPVFHTASQPERPGLGIHRLQRLMAYSTLPVYALGGMTEAKMKHLPPMDRLAGVAGISLFMKKKA